MMWQRAALMVPLLGIPLLMGVIYAATPAPSAPAPSAVDQFYVNKTIRMIIGSAAGGGYDIYARTLSNHLGKHIPGRPDVVPTNMPGAGSAKAAAYLYKIAPKDGSEIGALFPGAIMDPLVGENRDRGYDPSKFGYLGTLDHGTRICATYVTSKTKTFDDARNRRTVLGASQPGGGTHDYAFMLNNMTGTKFDIVAGYKGSLDILLAMERGEVEGLCGYDWSSLKSQRPEWIRDKKVNVFLQVALEPDPTLAGMGVPTLWHFIQNPEERKVAELIVSQQIFNRSYLVPPGIPADRLKALRDAFMATTTDPSFVADAKSARIDLSPLPGERVQQVVQELYASPADVVEKASQVIAAEPKM
jgi:tripartite-type tricarboxylate transporter receptor subunit TctC